jgi:hypothetical protein
MQSGKRKRGGDGGRIFIDDERDGLDGATIAYRSMEMDIEGNERCIFRPSGSGKSEDCRAILDRPLAEYVGANA